MSAILRKAIQKVATQLEDVRHEVEVAIDDNKIAVNTNCMRDAYELILVLSRLMDGKNVHEAFGAPGDWGYGTPIGDSIFEVYRTQFAVATLAAPEQVPR